MKYKDIYPVSRMCHMLGVSRSGYYDWRASPESKRSLENRILLKNIKEIHADSNKCYGSPKIGIELSKRGFNCGHNRVARIMRENDIKAKVVKKFRPRGSVIKPDTAALNVLNRQFFWEELNKAWATDITYIPTLSGWAYLCVFLDLCSRSIVGWSVSSHMRTEMVLQALDRAIARRKPGKDLIIHSDQGSQFGSEAFRSFLENNEFTQSMSRRGNCWDNACVESFFRLIKVEELNDYRFKNVEEVNYIVFKYIESFYNRRRIHSQLDYMTPVEYEKKLCA